MASKFGGVPIDEGAPAVSKFGGVPVVEEQIGGVQDDTIDSGGVAPADTSGAEPLNLAAAILSLRLPCFLVLLPSL